jgi:hypothetical protein
MTAMDTNKKTPKATLIPKKAFGQTFSTQVFVTLYRRELEDRAFLIEDGKA